MQRIDPLDKRKPYVQIAASIRAAILSGELDPGSQLPSGEELARFFGVSRMTVTAAVRVLREEGFIRSLAGSGVYVRDQAQLPVPDEEEHPLAGVAQFLYEMGHLKHTPRAGWLLLGIGQPESVAEHSFRVGMVGMALAGLAGADTGRVAALCLAHDMAETRITDVASVARAYVTTAAPEAVTAHQTSAMPADVAKAFQALTAEYEAGQTLEAQVARTLTSSKPCCRRPSTRPRDSTPPRGGRPRSGHCAPMRAGSWPGRSTQPGRAAGSRRSRPPITNSEPLRRAGGPSWKLQTGRSARTASQPGRTGKRAPRLAGAGRGMSLTGSPLCGERHPVGVCLCRGQVPRQPQDRGAGQVVVPVGERGQPAHGLALV